MDDGQRGKKFWEKQKGENDFFGSVLPVSLHLPSLQLMPAGKCVPIAKTSRGTIGAVSQEVRRHWFRSTEPLPWGQARLSALLGSNLLVDS